MKRLFITAMLGLLIAVPTFAIVGGELDADNEFPYVGAIIATYHPVFPTPQTASTATLIHPRVVMTAGHTVEFMRSLIENNVIQLSDFGVVFTPNAHDGTGTVYRIAETRLHEDYSGRDSSSIDIGLLILEEAVEGIEPVALPEEGFLDDLDLDRGPVDSKPPILIVGYGATVRAKDAGPLPPGERRVGETTFKALGMRYLLLAQKTQQDEAHISRGDSGGPALWELNDGTFVQIGIAAKYDSFLRTDIQTVMDFIQDAIDDAEAE